MERITSDARFREICRAGRGVVYNDFSGRGASGAQYNVGHAASCTWLRRSNVGVAKLWFAAMPRWPPTRSRSARGSGPPHRSSPRWLRPQARSARSSATGTPRHPPTTRGGDGAGRGEMRNTSPRPLERTAPRRATASQPCNRPRGVSRQPVPRAAPGSVAGKGARPKAKKDETAAPCEVIPINADADTSDTAAAQ